MNSRFKENIFTPILVIVILLLVVAMNFIPTEAVGIEDNPYLAAVVIQLVSYGIPALFYARLRGKKLTPSLNLRFVRPSHVLFLVMSAVFLLTGTVLVSMVMYKIAPAAFETSAVSEYASFAMNGRFFDGLYLIVAFAVLPAITEEFVFRGIVLGEYRGRGALFASVVSAAMFSMAHFSFVRFPVYFFSGLVLCLVTFATRSVVAAMIIHTLNNAFVLLCEKYVINAVDRQNVSLPLLIIIVGALCLVSCMLMLFEAHTIYRRYAEENVPSDYAAVKKKGHFARVAETFFSPTFLILVILYIVACLITA